MQWDKASIHPDVTHRTEKNGPHSWSVRYTTTAFNMSLFEQFQTDSREIFCYIHYLDFKTKFEITKGNLNRWQISFKFGYISK